MLSFLTSILSCIYLASIRIDISTGKRLQSGLVVGYLNFDEINLKLGATFLEYKERINILLATAYSRGTDYNQKLVFFKNVHNGRTQYTINSLQPLCASFEINIEKVFNYFIIELVAG